jgi:hypothetical protein
MDKTEGIKINISLHCTLFTNLKNLAAKYKME